MMFFELANAFAIFQNYINIALREYLNIFVLIYINDILIFFKTLVEHERQVRLVLKKLLQYKLYVNLNKCEFSVTQTIFLNFLISVKDIEMNSSRIEIMRN
jgi:hypothetical protein